MPALSGDEGMFAAATPRVDVKETDAEYEVSAELPGIDEKDVELTLANNALSIRGENKTSAKRRR